MDSLILAPVCSYHSYLHHTGKDYRQMTLALIGIPEDDSRPFIMAYVSSKESGEKIFRETQHLYIQKMKGFRIEQTTFESKRRGKRK